MKEPFIGFSNETLERQPEAHSGDTFTCPNCGEQHTLEAATNAEGRPDEVALFYTCRGKAYLGAVGGRSIIGVDSDVSGEVDL